MDTGSDDQRLGDRTAILDLVHTYAQGMDRRDADQVVGCFAPDAAWRS